MAVKEAYIRANPARWGEKCIPRGTVKRSRYFGNIGLLKAEPKAALRVSRKSRLSDALWSEFLGPAGDAVVVSTFFSPGEQVVLDKLLSSPDSRLIWVLPMCMPARIPVKWSSALLDGRALWLSAHPDEVREATRTTCLECNEWARMLARQEMLGSGMAPR